jgi:hypothetical protein
MQGMDGSLLKQNQEHLDAVAHAKVECISLAVAAGAVAEVSVTVSGLDYHRW